MGKRRDYNRESVEVCRNCKGSGVVHGPAAFHAHGREVDPEAVECAVCKGSGRVRKSLAVRVTIEPYVNAGGR
ncbi:MAG: hypothetical protein LBP56_07550 [Odoribacteraceae bacterium]|jgi:DnaJ-class molecular chaperone|nr:hypothetical protein [Odoribacteraceae bacterium]